MCDPCRIEISPIPSSDTVVGGVNRTGLTHTCTIYTILVCMYKADDRLFWLKAMTLQILRGQQYKTEERNCGDCHLHLYLIFTDYI